MARETKLEKLCKEIQHRLINGAILSKDAADAFSAYVEKWRDITAATKRNIAAAERNRQKAEELNTLIASVKPCVVTSTPNPAVHREVKKLFVGMLKLYTGQTSIKVWTDVRHSNAPCNIAGRQIKTLSDTLTATQLVKIDQALREKFNCRLDYVDNRGKIYCMSYFRVERL